MFLTLIQGLPLFSHGSEYSILSDKVIKIEVKYDTGEFFTGTDVLVFPPDQTEPAYTATTDETGCFYFQPDREGDWILQVRGEGGHGMRINMAIDQTMIAEGKTSNSLTFLQKLIMVLCVAWGTTGTVLFFRKGY